MSPRTGVAAAGLALLLAACQTLPAAPDLRVHRSLFDGSRSLPQRLVLLPVWMLVYDATSPNGGEIVEAWSVAAEADLTGAFLAWAAERENATVFPATDLDEEDRSLREHLALFNDVAVSAFSYPGETAVSGAERRAWWPRVASFDASLGAGLAPLEDGQGASAALIAVGRSVVHAPGQAATELQVGVVDLRSGDLLWLGRARDTRLSRSASAQDVPRLRARDVVDRALADYPGLAAYEALREEGSGP